MKRISETGGYREIKNIGVEMALQKIRYYCAYQERNHAETREKLYGYGLRKHEVDDILASLINDNFLNEERYALAFAGGKFRMKQWGRVKIKYALKLHSVSDYCIRKALASINEEEYALVLEKLFHAKLTSCRSDKNVFTKKRKVRQYLVQKGFEQGLVDELIKQI